MAEVKTKKNDASVEKFINSIADEQKRKDGFAILEMMKEASKLEPKMWGSSIIGFGEVHYKYESGHEGDICMIGFSATVGIRLQFTNPVEGVIVGCE